MLIQKFFFWLRYNNLNFIISELRKIYYQLMGMKIGIKTNLPSVFITWPHQVHLGNFCKLEKGIYFKYDGIWKHGASIIIGNNVFIGSFCEFNINHKIVIGNNVGIASGCRFIDHDHGIRKNQLIGLQDSIKASILVEDDVWLGCNVVVLKGVTVGCGAVVAAGSVVTKSIPPFEIWAGVPAKYIKSRV